MFSFREYHSGCLFFSVLFHYKKYTQMGDTLDDVVNAKKLL